MAVDILGRVKAFFEYELSELVREFIVLEYKDKPENDVLEPPVIIALVTKGRRKLFYFKQGTTFSDELAL